MHAPSFWYRAATLLQAFIDIDSSVKQQLAISQAVSHFFIAQLLLDRPPLPQAYDGVQGAALSSAYGRGSHVSPLSFKKVQYTLRKDHCHELLWSLIIALRTLGDIF